MWKAGGFLFVGFFMGDSCQDCETKHLSPLTPHGKGSTLSRNLLLFLLSKGCRFIMLVLEIKCFSMFEYVPAATWWNLVGDCGDVLFMSFVTDVSSASCRAREKEKERKAL